ncbi:MAG: hypothetical protein AABX66_00300 [Nanoarchaeota archaeon]
MHQTRKEISRQLPLQKKGTKYIARATANIKNSVPVVIAVRDMLKLAKTSAEVKSMIHKKQLKLNGKLVHDIHQSIQLFNIFDADQSYILTLLPTKKFSFEATSSKDRLCKIVSRRLVSNGKLQLNLHEGSNILGKDNLNIGDSLYLDFSNKIKSHKSLAKGVPVFISSGKYTGITGTVVSHDSHSVTIKISKGEVVLPVENVFVQ